MTEQTEPTIGRKKLLCLWHIYGLDVTTWKTKFMLQGVTSLSPQIGDVHIIRKTNKLSGSVDNHSSVGKSIVYLITLIRFSKELFFFMIFHNSTPLWDQIDDGISGCPLNFRIFPGCSKIKIQMTKGSCD